MDRKYNNNNISFAKELRKNMTKEERHLWYDFLRSYPVKFTRQKVLGRFIADLYCSDAKLILICIVFYRVIPPYLSNRQLKVYRKVTIIFLK